MGSPDPAFAVTILGGNGMLLRKQKLRIQPHHPIALGSCFRRSTAVL